VHIANTYRYIVATIKLSNSLPLFTNSISYKNRQTGYAMSRKPQSKDEALEALDFIVNVLKEHEKDLDKLIGELGVVTEALGATGELNTKVEKIEDRITGLQGEITNLINYISSQPQHAAVAPTVSAAMPAREAPKPETAPPATTTPMPTEAPVAVHGPPVILRCKQWEDFQNLATQAQTISFMAKEAEHTFQADALKGSQIITFNGEIPKLAPLLKIWLSKQLDISDRKVLEGVLAIA
jgi:hypothetical protein